MLTCSSSPAIENIVAEPDGKIRLTYEIVDRFLDGQTDKVTSGTARSLLSNQIVSYLAGRSNPF